MSPNFPPHFNLEWQADLEISAKSVLPQYKYLLDFCLIVFDMVSNI